MFQEAVSIIFSRHRIKNKALEASKDRPEVFKTYLVKKQNETAAIAIALNAILPHSRWK